MFLSLEKTHFPTERSIHCVAAGNRPMLPPPHCEPSPRISPFNERFSVRPMSDAGEAFQNVGSFFQESYV